MSTTVTPLCTDKWPCPAHYSWSSPPRLCWRQRARAAVHRTRGWLAVACEPSHCLASGTRPSRTECNVGCRGVSIFLTLILDGYDGRRISVPRCVRGSVDTYRQAEWSNRRSSGGTSTLLLSIAVCCSFSALDIIFPSFINIVRPHGCASCTPVIRIC